LVLSASHFSISAKDVEDLVLAGTRRAVLRVLGPFRLAMTSAVRAQFCSWIVK